MTDLEKLEKVLREIGIEEINVRYSHGSKSGYKVLSVDDTASDYAMSFIFLNGKYEYCDTPSK